MHRVPKTNNAVESFNSNIKKYQLHNQKKPLKQFLKISMKCVRQRSKAYKQQKKPFQTELNISPELMKKGVAYTIKSFVHRVKENHEIDIFVYCSEMNTKITLSDVEKFEKCTYRSWDQFKDNAFKMWKMTFPKETKEWTKSVCTCPAFGEEFMCKHIIGMARKMDLIEIIEDEGPNYDTEPLFASKAGRPKKPTSSLNFE